MEAAESLLRGADRAARPTEAVTGHRLLGLTRLVQGDFAQARERCEQALRIYDPERDREAKFRLGVDSRAMATAQLALAAWHLGEVSRAAALMDEAVAHAAESAHVPTIVGVYIHQAWLEDLRNDAEAAQRAAEDAVALCREHGLSSYLVWGALQLACARAKIGESNGGLTALRQALADYTRQGNKLLLPFYKGRLVETEADREGAQAALDEALALAGETGERLYFEGAGGEALGRRGFSKDHRPDLNQMILAVLLDGDGRPVCTEMWPGNTADVTSLIPAVDRLRKRFSINRVCVVADRGMISAETIAELEARKLLYILGVRERTDKLVRELVLDDPAPFVPFFLTKRKKEIDYEAKAVTLAGRRYIVCRNHDQMRKDAAARAAILAALERELKKGDKALVGNKGFRRFLMKPDDGHFAIDRAKAEEDAKFDGVFVLRTNARLSPLEAMLVYKQLWTVDIDQTWRLSRIKGWRVWGNARKQGAAEWQGCRAGGFEFGDCRRVRGDEFVEGP